MNKIADPQRRARDVKFIHAAARELGLDRAAYEDMLFTLTRCRSCSEMDFTGLQRVREHLLRCGAGAAGKQRPAPAPLPAEWAWAAGHKDEKTLRALIAACGRAGVGAGSQVAYLEGMLEQRRGAHQPLAWCRWPDYKFLFASLKACAARQARA